MTRVSPIDQDFFPPFDGFPAKGIEFLSKLKKNNNRKWFTKHKSDFEDYVKLPMQSLVVSLKPLMEKFAPEIEANPRRSLFRIYRDTRFSKDKTPYKTHIAAVLHPRGHWQESAGYYVHIEPGGSYAGGGIYMPDKDQLKKIRTALVERADEFLAIVETPKFVKRFDKIEGEKLQRTPQGFPADHPMREWLKYKQFFAGVEWKAKECKTEKFAEKVAVAYKDLYPFIRFLNSALGKV